MKTKNWLFAGALAAAAAILYFASLAGYAFPGESAQLMVYWKGLDVPDAPVYPLMAFFAKLLGGGNLIAPVCGVVSTVLLFLLVSAFIAARVTGEGAEKLEKLLDVINTVDLEALTASIQRFNSVIEGFSNFSLFG